MKMRALRTVLAASAVGAAAAANLRHGEEAPTVAQPPAKANLVQSTVQVVNSAEAEFVAKQLLAEKVGIQQAVNDVHDKMTVEDAMRRLDGKLSDDVSSLLHTDAAAAPKFSEKSLAKARNILNKMVQDSFAELDDVIVECKAFENMNRVSFSQVSTDLNRLGSEMADTEKNIADNTNCMATQDKETKKTTNTLSNERSSYERIRAQNQQELTIRKNDLAVFNFIMEITKCKGKSLLQAANASSLRVCSTEAGYELDFEDPEVQGRISKMMTPRAQRVLDAALGAAFSTKIQEAAALVQGEATTKAAATTPMPVKVTPRPVPVKETPPQSTQWKKCVDGKPNCGLLHDTMSLQWGKFKDLVDELQAEMDKNKDAWGALREDLNEQLDVISARKGKCQTGFSTAVGTKNMLQTESDEKTTQMRELTVDYEKHMAVCKARVEELLFTDVCAVKKVRNEVLKSSKVSPPSKISDCEVSDWTAEECSVRCDNSCPKRIGGKIDPFSCGGKKTLRRGVIVKANQFGIVCPSLRKQTRCGQYKCAVDCVMSKWSGWSKCTKDCGGGARQKTRSVMVKPNHGGKFCDTPVETEACNTGSCDRNCKLDRWSQWSPCSMACNPGRMPGFQEKSKKVLVPIRGNGQCPSQMSSARFRKRRCNQQPCYGDEVCIARQDLIIALDASGSLRESGFEVLRNFAANLTGSYRSKYYGRDQAQLGVILFGNGVLAADGTTSRAINLVGLTADLKKVKDAILKTKWQRGYTNMAQAFVLADTMFQQGGRPGAQSAVLVLSDGRYSFAFETEQAVNKLKAKGTMIYFAPVADRAGDWQHKLKTWASQPWETNYEHLPGLQSLKSSMGQFSATLVAKFCPRAISPTLQMNAADRRGYMVMREKVWPMRTCLVKNQQQAFGWIKGGAAACYRRIRARAPKFTGMMMTRRSRAVQGRRFCWGQNYGIDTAMWRKLLTDRTAFKCKSGKFVATPNLDVYAIKPMA